MKTYEVFLKPIGRDPFEHAGSLSAPDDELALVYARESYCRRGEGDEIWVVDRSHLLHGGSEYTEHNRLRAAAFASNDGAVVAQRRKDRRAAAKAGQVPEGQATAPTQATELREGADR